MVFGVMKRERRKSKFGELEIMYRFNSYFYTYFESPQGLQKYSTFSKQTIVTLSDALS